MYGDRLFFYKEEAMEIKKIIIAPDSFKGSLSSVEAAKIIEEEARLAFPKCETVVFPIADGGEGSLDTIYAASGGSWVSAKALSPDDSIIDARYLLLDRNRAALELAESSGFTKQNGLHPLTSSSLGFGQLILDALERGARDFTLCIGGSASTDGGCGMAAALGVRFYDKDGKVFSPTGGTLRDIESLDASLIDPRIRHCNFTVMCDVKNPLYGENGAAYRYAPQKGASAEQTALLDAGLRNLSEKLTAYYGTDFSSLEGAGAAGGLGAGCVAFLGARLTSGIDAMLSLCGFKAAVKDANAVITGEGKLDEQSLMGKVLNGIIEGSGGLPVISVCGVNKCYKALLERYNVTAFEAAEGVSAEECIAHPTEYVKRASKRAMEYLKTLKENEK